MRTGRAGKLACLLALPILVAGCVTTPAPAPPVQVASLPAPATAFTVQAVQLDTWNALGQLLVNTAGVTYRARAQMMGLYDVDYRGERILVIARAFVLDAHTPDSTTEVRVATVDGKPDASPAATDLLAQLQARLPAELQRIASLPAPKPARKRKHKHR